jgi:hypothetical protein
MLYREIIAVCSEIHTKHINTLCRQNVEFVNVKPGGTYSNHSALRCYCSSVENTVELACPSVTIYIEAICNTPVAYSYIHMPLNSTQMSGKVSRKMFLKFCFDGCTAYYASKYLCRGGVSALTIRVFIRTNGATLKTLITLHCFVTVHSCYLLTPPSIYSSLTFHKTNILFVKFDPHWEQYESMHHVREFKAVPV